MESGQFVQRFLLFELLKILFFALKGAPRLQNI